MHASASIPHAPIDNFDPGPIARSLIFTPSPQLQAQVLTDLADYNHSLQSIAIKHQITLEALTLWMATPAIAATLCAIESAAALHNRLAASTLLPRAIPVLMDSITAYQWEETHLASDHSHASLTNKHKRRESARRATNLLLRISRATAPTTPITPTHRAIKVGPARRPDLDADAPDATVHTPTPRATKIGPALRPDLGADLSQTPELPLHLPQLTGLPSILPDPPPSAKSAAPPPMDRPRMSG